MTSVPIEVNGLTKQFGHQDPAVAELSFRVAPGRITGFLGPNGAGKTTTLRCLVGLMRPTSGEALIAGRRYADLPRPTTVVGAVLDVEGFNPARTAREHLLIRAYAGGIDRAQVDPMLDFVGLSDAKDRKAGQLSLGMSQRLALAVALLADPPALILDEPANGLDPAGIAWLRTFLRGLADEGRTVLVSSHQLAEMRQTVDDVVIIDRGRLVRAGPLGDVVGTASVVHVTGPDLTALVGAVAAAGGSTQGSATDLAVTGLTPEQVGHLAWQHHLEIHGLRAQAAELEDVFLTLTSDRRADP